MEGYAASDLFVFFYSVFLPEDQIVLGNFEITYKLELLINCL